MKLQDLTLHTIRRMRWMLIVVCAAALDAADEQLVALMAKASAAFELVQPGSVPDVRHTSACVQAQAALLPVASPDELPAVHFRKGYCTLANAAVTRSADEFSAAAAEFDKAIQSWSARILPKTKTAEPISSGLLVLNSIARLQAGADDAAADLARNQIAAVIANPDCLSTVMPRSFCDAVLRTGREWLGWMALSRNDFVQAGKLFADAPGWSAWVAGRRAFELGRYTDAAVGYGRAIPLLHPATPTLAERLGPPAEKAPELTEYGGALLLAGRSHDAIAALDSAIKIDPAIARAYYLRAQAREAGGDSAAALADYNLASRTAFAHSKDLASGEAHLYRGILFYRRKDYAHAEDEFASALNFEIAPSIRADAVAWRHLAAVAAGACETSRQFLERSLDGASPYFPRQEARAAIAACRVSGL
jgi:tetratricopeptide (TPR) repeat protein